jgi:hypothetical protein
LIVSQGSARARNLGLCYGTPLAFLKQETMIAELTDTEREVFTLLANGWVATLTIEGEFRINNGPAQDMAIIERLVELGLVAKSSERAYVATVCSIP